ncbi:hypothetical protein HOI26_00135 [Candidatus Woesearchaeota archaeon]|mgnify:FL=1|jgi:hypothetical protein|nr:hypothetical protein [Candidatus Woesearchaeota archaeon]MBT5739482.1 hypothetical protein [Candidatus Woesearchaeota archaeon]
MRISFFEEFPTKKNLDKLKLIDWPTTVYVAAKSVKEYEKLIKPYKKKNITFGYWPILEKKEGYWLSPFSSAKAVKKTIQDVKRGKRLVMWDAELPFRHPWLFLRLGYFIKNKVRIKKFFKRYGKKIVTAEYPIKGKFSQWILTFLSVSFSPKRYGNKKIVMYYTSMHKGYSWLLLKQIKNLHRKYGKDLHVGLGTIATGILGDEPILKRENLERDLKTMKKIGISEVVIFRLGGLNKKYIKTLQNY